MIASCSANGNTYPVGPTNSPYNTIPANATQVIWNPWEWEQIPGQTPFAEATYVLKIWDERGPGSTIKGGWMSPYSGTQFSMYRPAQYQSIGGELGSSRGYTERRFSSSVDLPPRIPLALPFALPLRSSPSLAAPSLTSHRPVATLMTDGWKCSTCNAAMTQLGEPASLAFMVTFAALFFSMWNIWRR